MPSNVKLMDIFVFILLKAVESSENRKRLNQPTGLPGALCAQ